MDDAVGIADSAQTDVLFHPMHPLIVGECLRQLAGRANLRPRKRAAMPLQHDPDLIAKRFIRRRHSTGAVPVHALALRTDAGLNVEVARHPFVAAPLAAVAHDGNWNAAHNNLPP